MIIFLRIKFGMPVLFCFLLWFLLFFVVVVFVLFCFFWGGGGVFFSTGLPILFCTLSALKSFIGLFFLNYGQNKIHSKC